MAAAPLRGLSPRPYAYGVHALPAELRRPPDHLRVQGSDKLELAPCPACSTTVACLCRRALQRAMQGGGDIAAGPGAQAGAQRCRPAAAVARAWLSAAPQRNVGHGSSPLRGLSPRPYAYGAHALPAELRRPPHYLTRGAMSSLSLPHVPHGPPRWPAAVALPYSGSCRAAAVSLLGRARRPGRSGVARQLLFPGRRCQQCPIGALAMAAAPCGD